MTWIAPTLPTVVDGPLTGPDRPILEGFLSWERTTLLTICAGLTSEQLAARPVPASTLSLLGLVRHLAKVERTWLRQRAAGQDIEGMYDAALGKDADFDDTDPSRAPEDFARLTTEWQLADAAVAGLDFDHEVDVRGETMSLRLIYVHLIAEYSRHNGHGDLLRQSIDGVTAR